MGIGFRFKSAAGYFLFFVVCAAFSAGGKQEAANVRAAVENAIERMRPALVRIHVVSTEYREGREIKMQAVGSGAIISKDGYLITTHPVAGNSARIVCTLRNPEEIDA